MLRLYLGREALQGVLGLGVGGVFKVCDLALHARVVISHQAHKRRDCAVRGTGHRSDVSVKA